MNRRIQFAIVLCIALTMLSACGGGGSNNTSPVNPPSSALLITTTTIPDGVVGKPYSATLTATGGTAPYTWSTPNPLPQGLIVNSSGQISGTPTSEFSLVPIFSVTDSSTPMKSATAAIFLTVARELLITTASVAGGHTNVSYSSVIQSNTATVNTWSVSLGQLPPGMQLANPASSQIEIAGTTTQAGNYSFSIQAQSTNNPPQVVSQAFTLVVDSNAAITTAQLPDIIRTVAYSTSLSAVNGTPPYHYVALATLPAGLTLSDRGQISGTYNGNGPVPINVPFRVTDSASASTSSTRTLAFNAVNKLTIGNQLFDGVLNQPYNGNLVAVEGRAPYTFSLLSGSVPPGLTLNSAGQLIGSPTQLGTFSFTARCQDATVPPQTASLAATVKIVPPPLTMPVSLPGKIPQGVAFTGYIAALGGVPPYTFSITSGALPTGLSLNASTGQVTGTPTVLGQFNLVAQTVDSGSPPQSSSIGYTINVVPALARNDSIQKATAIGNGMFGASISPYADPVDIANPDMDYYKIVVDQSATVTFSVNAKESNPNNPLDSVIEVVDANGATLNFCNQPDNPSGPFTSACMNDDITLGVQRDSQLYLKMPGAAGTHQTVYLRVFDWTGSARPDMTYILTVSGAAGP
jgi:Putative Ig domain